jgi:hypothetical protein
MTYYKSFIKWIYDITTLAKKMILFEHIERPKLDKVIHELQ